MHSYVEPTLMNPPSVVANGVLSDNHDAAPADVHHKHS